MCLLETQNLSRLNYGQIENLNRHITCKEIEPTKKSTGPDGFTSEFDQTLEEELTPILLKLFHLIEEEGVLSNSFF